MILKLDKYQETKEKLFPNKKVVCTCGWFDPLHPGHASLIMESKKLGDILVVLVNGDQMAATKKGKPFMPAQDRADIVDCIKGVDYTVIYDHPTEYSILGGLQIIKPDVFAKGGDRDLKDADDPNSPVNKERAFIESYGGQIVYGVGKDKVWSSSNYLQEWVDFTNSSEHN